MSNKKGMELKVNVPGKANTQVRLVSRYSRRCISYWKCSGVVCSTCNVYLWCWCSISITIVTLWLHMMHHYALIVSYTCGYTESSCQSIRNKTSYSRLRQTQKAILIQQHIVRGSLFSCRQFIPVLFPNSVLHSKMDPSKGNPYSGNSGNPYSAVGINHSCSMK